MKTVDYAILLNTRKSELSARDLVRVIDYLNRVVDQDTRIIAENPDAARYLYPEYSQNLLKEYQDEKQRRADAENARFNAALNSMKECRDRIAKAGEYVENGLLASKDYATEIENQARNYRAHYKNYLKAFKEYCKYL